MESSQDFKSMQEKVQAALVSSTRTSNQIAAEDLSFQRSSNPAVDEQLDDVSERLLALSSSLLKSATKNTDLKAPELEDADDVDMHWVRIVDVIDTLLEKADTCLDEYTGLVKRKGAPTEELGSQPKKPKTFAGLDHSMRRANILKPQNAFDLKPDNFDTSPWKPILSTKPHASLPLEDSLGPFDDDEHTVQFKHPYETEILHLQFPDFVYQTQEPIKYQPVETTVATFVDTYEGVLEMLQELKQAKEIAIDTEHHDFRTYSGLLSLMQISTREKDWIVDTLQPWRHKLEVLNEVFADPSIIKVLHGAYMDIIWLQRDCGLYIVGLFDTYEASVSLGYSGRSLAYLLKRFVDFDADKKYQLADWRIRPIPDEMFYYARSDTHYLLYIYDMIRNELLESSDRSKPEQDLVSHVLERSKETSLRRHEKTPYDAEGGQGPFGWFNLLVKQSAGSLSREQFAVFRAVHQWRDTIARRDDESPLFVMSNPAIFDVARRLPPDPKALHGIIDATSSNTAKRSVGELFAVVEKARNEGLNGPSVSEFFRANTVGIGAVAQQVFPQLKPATVEPPLETTELVADNSKLWGQVPLSTRWEATSDSNRTKIVQFALPWAAFVDNMSISEPTEVAVLPPVQTPASQQIGAEDGDNEFTLKAGRKRIAPILALEKQQEDEGEVSTSPPEPESAALSGDEISVHSSTDEEEKIARKRAAKKERKALKKLKKAKAEGKAPRNGKGGAEHGLAEVEGEVAADDDDEDEDEAPFDYTKAQSVLHPKRDAVSTEGKAKVFNPYSSLSAQGPKPGRRMHGEKPGKSATFKTL